MPPAPVDDGDPASVELGTKFRSDTNGYVTAVRFYKAAANTGSHTGSLWSVSGTHRSSVTVTLDRATLPGFVTTYVYVTLPPPMGNWVGFAVFDTRMSGAGAAVATTDAVSLTAAVWALSTVALFVVVPWCTVRK